MRCFFVSLMVMVLGVLPGFGDEYGNCGYGVSFYFKSSTGELTISGKGEVWEKTFANNYVIKSVVIEEGVTNIPDELLAHCYNIETVVIPSTVRSIGASAFANCERLRSVVVPPSVKSIGDHAFVNCFKLEYLTLGGAMTVGQYAFSGCEKLRFVYLVGAADLKEYAFANCGNIQEIVVMVNEPFAISPKAFANFYGESEPLKNTFVKVKVGKKPLFKATEGWKEFAKIRETVFDMNELFRDKRVDCNRDGLVNAADVVSIYNYIIGE